MSRTTDAIVIGGGPSGAGTAILLARAGWRVTVVEQDEYPRRKVCGECIAAGSLALLDEFGVGAGVRAHAGPELRKIGWMSDRPTVTADFPTSDRGPYRYGRALRREHLDRFLLDQAVADGVTLLQPARVRAVRGKPGAFHCDIDRGFATVGADIVHESQLLTVDAPVVIDAHGSWQRAPHTAIKGQHNAPRAPHRGSNLFAFKAVFLQAALQPDLLPLIAFAGGYGGMVTTDQGHTTLACCVRRDTLSCLRAAHPGQPVGEAVEAHLRTSCLGVREALDGARRDGAWLAVGPIQPGIRVHGTAPMFRVGNAAGESHPLVGEGISMALCSAFLLASELTRQPPMSFVETVTREVQSRYAVAWRQAFSQRINIAALYAQVVMKPRLARPARALFERWPHILTQAARFAGKARASTFTRPPSRYAHEHS